eukprot:SAG22_NODE_290_length_12941_cov_3.715465_4_plen_33_part_00
MLGFTIVLIKPHGLSTDAYQLPQAYAALRIAS